MGDVTGFEAQSGPVAAAAAAYTAGFRGDDLTTITMIAGRESRWQSDRINPHTSDRGMWQINWNNLQRAPYDDLRERLGITSDRDLLDLDTNAAVAFWMYEDAIRSNAPWFPWRASDTGRDGSGPGWDPKGSHLWRTDEFAADAAAAARTVVDGERTGGTYTVTAADSDGFVALVSRCTGLGGTSWSVRQTAAEKVARHNRVPLDHTWHPGDQVNFPMSIPGVRVYVVQPGDGLFAIARGLGLDRSEYERVAEINAWQGDTPHPGVTWFGGPS